MPCKIVVVGLKDDNCLVELNHLPSNARVIAYGCNLKELEESGDDFSDANVIYNIAGTAATLPSIIARMPHLTWIHSLTAGVDHILCPAITTHPTLTLTNAKGVYSSSLGEYVIGACLYFAKDFGRLNQQKADKEWNRFDVKELKG